MGRPNPDKGLHANRKYSTIWTSKGPANCMSRTDILNPPHTPTYTHWMTGQSMGETGGDPYTFPTDWPKTSRVLGVPKCVILSSLPNWSLMWEKDDLYAPRDVVGQMFTSPFLFGNYYYIEQWDEVEDPNQLMGGAYNPADPRWTNGSTWNTTTTDQTAYSYNNNAQNLRDASGNPVPADIPGDLNTDGGSNYSGSRLHENVGSITNQIPTLHRQCIAAFQQAANILLGLKEPIYVLAPEWFPPACYKIRNGYLTESATAYRRAAREPNGPCGTVDVEACYTSWRAPWGPAYPNTSDPRNTLAFTHPKVPWLSSIDPGFGTNCLHMYCGMPMHNYSPTNVMFQEQAYPFTPEGIYIGPDLISTYIGTPHTPFFSGRRAIWRDAGFDYGYKAGVPAVYNNYAPMISGAASSLSENYWKHRNFDTVLTTYPGDWFNIAYDPGSIFRDQQSDCAATAFYFGFTFSDWINRPGATTEDSWYVDCSGDSRNNPGHLKYSEHFVKDPSSQSLRDAIGTFLPPVIKRIHDYYDNIKQGTLDYYQYAIDQNDLGDKVTVAPDLDMTSPDSIVSYVTDYFKSRPS